MPKLISVSNFSVLDNVIFINFFIPYFQLENWLDELRAEKDCSDELADSPEAAEQQLEQCASHQDTSLNICLNTIMEGETLLQELR